MTLKRSQLQITNYDNLVKMLILIAEEETPVTVGPPEAPWYGVWDTVLWNMKFLVSNVAVNPQMTFRARTAAVKNHTSTRFTDFGLISLRMSEFNGRSKATRVPILAVEIKPFSPNIEGNILQGRIAQAQSDLEIQLNHYFASLDDGSGSPVIIGVAVAGRYWYWGRYTRNPGTPARNSTQNIEAYLESHSHLLSVFQRRSRMYELGQKTSDEALIGILRLVAKNAPD
jgi:hypothetical protein